MVAPNANGESDVRGEDKTVQAIDAIMSIAKEQMMPGMKNPFETPKERTPNVPEAFGTPPKKRGRKPRTPKADGPSASSPPQKVIAHATPQGRLSQKIAAVTKLIKRLEANDKNESENFAFVSIDEYYEKVALQIAQRFGLCWVFQEETAQEQRFSGDCNDLHIRKVFSVTIFDDTGDAMSLAHNISVTLPYEGATTTGKALSYADKAFMRQTFKIPTKEADADKDKAVTKSEQSQQKNADKKDGFFGSGSASGRADAIPGTLMNKGAANGQ